ncbi:terminal uridylyltransferase 4 isoform X1 [Latimeria chalumnae]|uniref:terminal uridylyltransferase 4 isoform X1 n=1 Tax=Latimeria chalumnae TaxID=7897 RepID=UPI0003C13323|nr:PREDICTED: terminal uridylyltransferase 4 isoform X1 [Latimeria chalumnae]|eukprot:XP_006006033.1 PREDICTED: terminal uridylyltransferase 4 isoform X1 [Latimeria chalumnae]
MPTNMEDPSSSKSENHDIRKPSRLGHGEGKSIRIIVNNDIYKHRNEGPLREGGRGTLNWNNKKGKQNDAGTEKSEGKLCKTVQQNCSTRCTDLGVNPQNQGHGKANRSVNGGVLTEKTRVKQVRVQQPSGKSPNPDAAGNGTSEECIAVKQKGDRTAESVVEIRKSQVPESKNSECGKPEEGSDLEEEFDYLDKGSDVLLKEDSCTMNENSDSRLVIDESSLTAEHQLGLKQAEERLQRDYICRLEKRSPEYSNCQYLCKLCLVHIENIQGAHKHIKEKRHKKNIMEKQEENDLRALPPPSPSQLSALSAAIIKATRTHGISEEDFRVRQKIVLEMETIILQHLPGCTLRMYGSCLTRFAFKTSDINIDVKFPPNLSQPDVLIQVLDILKNSSSYSDVESDFHAKVPIVSCRDKKSDLICKVSAGNDMACLTTNLLAALGKQEPRLTPLVLAFRYWAKLCHVDCQAEGGIPSYSFPIMVIFFLQQRKEPILPVFLGTWVEGFDLKRIDDYHLKGVEKDKFIHWEYRPSNSGEGRHVNGGEGKTKAEQRKSGNKKTESSETDGQSSSVKQKQDKSWLKFEAPPKASLGQLWLELLKFYTLEFALEEHVISIRVKELLIRENKNWPKRRIAIEDPFALKRNVARSLNSQMVFEYILERFRVAYKYFACPQSKDETKSKLDTKKKEKTKTGSKKPIKSGETVTNCCLPQWDRSIEQPTSENGSRTDNLEAVDYSKTHCTSVGCTSNGIGGLLNRNNGIDTLCNAERCKGDTSNTGTRCLHCKTAGKAHEATEPLHSSENLLREAEVGHTCNGDDNLKSCCLKTCSVLEEKKDGCSGGIPCSQKAKCTGVCTTSTSHSCKAVVETHTVKKEERTSAQEMCYVFDKFILTSGKPPTIVCSICKRDGHSKNDCPEDFKKIDLKPLPPMTDRFREILDKVCKKCYNERSPPPSEQQNREHILASLERFIRKEYNDKARLCLFGSSKNGFGFRNSDLDICMTLEGHETAEKLNSKEIIEGLAKVLKKHPGLRDILPITTAKVPIVKFKHRDSDLEGDISLYNTLAQHNTRMLATYAAIDPRVQYLGYTMKVFAKCCDIGDASRGSLSSYAYILMVLYFLQQREPPVIPVLQEIFDGTDIPQRMVDGWNAFFFDEINELKKRLPELGKNTESVGELWLGLLRFYTEEFDFKEYVISIRQKKLLTTFEKQWTSKCIAIEDPFDLNHNLGAGVSRKMTNFIMKAFINGRKLFGTPVYPQPGTERDYFFDSKVLTDGELAPNDRCCRICGKIGHYMKDCPKRRRTKKKENEKEDEKEAKEEEREPREKRCFICGDTGHVRRDCPEYRQARQRNNSVSSVAVPVPQMVRSLGSAQPISVSQPASSPHQGQDQPVCTRQPSESSESHQTPPYSPQPQPQQFTQNSSQSTPTNSSPSQQSTCQTRHVQQQQVPQAPPQVQLPLFNFPQPSPNQYPSLRNMGLLQTHQLQISNNSWPIHGPVVHSAPTNSHPAITYPVRPSNTSSTVNNQSTLGLNDPSIIFAQPAARPMGIPNTSHERFWHGHMTPNSVVGNGSMGNSDQGFQGQFTKLNPTSVTWEHPQAAHFPLLQALWPYNMPQNYLQQGSAGYQQNKSFYPQGPLMQNNQRFPLLSQGHPPMNINYIQQKK